MIEQVLTMKRTAALCLVGAFCSLNAQAQKIQVKGNLVDLSLIHISEPTRPY